MMYGHCEFSNKLSFVTGWLLYKEYDTAKCREGKYVVIVNMLSFLHEKKVPKRMDQPALNKTPPLWEKSPNKQTFQTVLNKISAIKKGYFCIIWLKCKVVLCIAKYPSCFLKFQIRKY